MQISTGLPRPDALALHTLQVPEVAMQGACIDSRMLFSSETSPLLNLSDLVTDHESVQR